MTVLGQDHVAVAAAPYQAQDLGYQQIAMTGSAVAPSSIPTDARWALITVEGGTTADTVRWHADGVAPASGSGNPIPAPASSITWPPLLLACDFTSLQFIGAPTSKVNINFYR